MQGRLARMILFSYMHTSIQRSMLQCIPKPDRLFSTPNATPVVSAGIALEAFESVTSSVQSTVHVSIGTKRVPSREDTADGSIQPSLREHSEVGGPACNITGHRLQARFHELHHPYECNHNANVQSHGYCCTALKLEGASSCSPCKRCC